MFDKQRRANVVRRERWEFIVIVDYYEHSTKGGNDSRALAASTTIAGLAISMFPARMFNFTSFGCVGRAKLIAGTDAY